MNEERRKELGALYVRDLPNGDEIVVHRMIYTTRICVGEQGGFGYRRAWCYPNPAVAVLAAEAWDGEGDPPDGWVKEVGTERRRVGGDPEREFDANLDPEAASVGGWE